MSLSSNWGTKRKAAVAKRTNSSTKLMNEICDEFLICKICFEPYKQPKTLSCLHIFCLSCLEQHYEAEMERSYRFMLYTQVVTCPICRKRTELPQGSVRRLPDNFLVSNLTDVIRRRKPSAKAPMCEICKPKTKVSSKQAVSKCLECAKLMCKSCLELHRRTKVTQSHSLVDVDVEKEIECKVHSEEIVRFYCEPCEMCICILCTFQEHKGHEVSSFTEGMNKYRNSLDALISACRERVSTVKEQLELIQNCESGLKNAEVEIRDFTIDSIAAIRRNERELIEGLYNFYGEETLQFLKEKESLQEILENLQGTCNFTDVILKDESIELLLVKKEIQEKLKVLLQRKVEPAPSNVVKQVNFIPANLSLSYLDTDGESRPESTSNQLSVTNGLCADTQTEAVELEERGTTMGRLLEPSVEELTQTDCVQVSDKRTSPLRTMTSNNSTMTSPTETTDQTTMTPTTPTRKRKVQTMSVDTTSRETATKVILTDSKCTNTAATDTCDRSTATLQKEFSDRPTDTCGLVHVSDCAVEVAPLVKTLGTSTDKVPMIHRSTYRGPPDQADKITNTPKVSMQNTQTNTSEIKSMDIGVTARTVGTNKATSTKVIVLSHAGTGDQDIRTTDQCSNTLWQSSRTLDAGTMHDIVVQDKGMTTESPSMQDEIMYTDFFNMVDKSIATLTQKVVSKGTLTTSPISKSVGLNTPKVKTHEKAVVAAMDEVIKVQTKVAVIQTILSFASDLVMPNLQPHDKETNTLPAITHEIGTDAESAVDVANVATKTDLPATKTVETNTDKLTTDTVDVISTGMTTEQITKQDNSHDTYRGIVRDANTNTDVNLSIKPVVATCDKGVTTDNSTDLSSLTSDKPTTAMEIALADAECNTELERPVSVSRKTTMLSRVATAETGTSTLDLTPNDINRIPMTDSATSMRSCVLTSDAETSPKQISTDDLATVMDTKTLADRVSNDITTNTLGTTTHHLVTSSDQSTDTPERYTCDAETNVDAAIMTNSTTMTYINTKDVAILKRPHTISRATLMAPVSMVDSKTGMDVVSTKEVASWTTKVETSDMEVTACTIDTQSVSTETPITTSKDASAQVSRATVRHQDTSPMRYRTIERKTGPDRVAYRISSTSPVRFGTSERSVLAKPQVLDVYTSTSMVKSRDRGTNPSPAKLINRESSPIPCLFKKDVQDTSTCTPQVTTEDRESSPIPIAAKDCGTSTNVVELINRGSSPILVASLERGTQVLVSTANQKVGTPHVYTSETSMNTKQILMSNTATWMPSVAYLEKETCTPQVHVLHKNISTDTTETSEKQTCTFDVTAAYREVTTPVPPATVSRGTCTPQAVSHTKHTSTLPIPSDDKASSPVRFPTFDKSVSAKSGEIIEPVDTFQSAGMSFISHKQDTIRPTLESIREDSKESYTSSDDDANKEHALGKSILAQYPFQGGNRESVIMHKENFMASASATGSQHGSTFTCNGRGFPTSILLKVETGTNTPAVFFRSKSTSTPYVSKEDKSISTETITVDGKMAECINKLKTVRQRLEQQPPYSPSSPIPKATSTEVQTATTPLSLSPISDKGVADRSSDSEPTPFVLPLLRRKSLSTSDSYSESDTDQQTGRSRHRLARKQRPDILELLRSASTPSGDKPPTLPKPKLHVQAVHSQVVPKLTLGDCHPDKENSRDTKKYRSKRKVKMGDVRVDSKTSPISLAALSSRQQRDLERGSSSSIKHRQAELPASVELPKSFPRASPKHIALGSLESVIAPADRPCSKTRSKIRDTSVAERTLSQVSAAGLHSKRGRKDDVN